MKYEIQLIDVCLPDYFRGHHLPIIQFPVFGSLTLGQVKEELISEVNMLCDYYEEPEKLIEAIIAMESDKPNTALFFTDIEIPPDDPSTQPEWVYAYFVAVPL